MAEIYQRPVPNRPLDVPYMSMMDFTYQWGTKANGLEQLEFISIKDNEYYYIKRYTPDNIKLDQIEVDNLLRSHNLTSLNDINIISKRFRIEKKTNNVIYSIPREYLILKLTPEQLRMEAFLFDMRNRYVAVNLKQYTKVEFNFNREYHRILREIDPIRDYEKVSLRIGWTSKDVS